MATEAFAPAKVNLTLHVTGQRADGYHLLDSLVVFADVGDRLALNRQAQMTLEVIGEYAPGVPDDARNLVWQAAQAIGWTGSVRLDKVLPHGGGIGGGSSDAAAFLKAAASAGSAVSSDIPLRLGADVPVCMHARAARIGGIGERIEPVQLPELHAVLVNPGVSVPTGSVFSALASRENQAMPPNIPVFSGVGDCADWLCDQRNDLETPACQIAPEVAQVLDALGASRDVLLARMSGSGSTCFGLYPSQKAAHFAAYEIGAAHPKWWCRATTLS